MRALPSALSLLLLVLIAAGSGPAEARPRKGAKPKVTAAQKQADRHFKNGVALYQERKYSEALAEFQRAHEIAPHPLVLYNIATTYRELSRYKEAVEFYGRFLAEAEGVVAPARVQAARAELEEILGRVARVTVDVAPAGAEVTVDGEPVDLAEMPLFLPPGEHRIAARASGHEPGERTVRVASGDEVSVAMALDPVREEPVAAEGIGVEATAAATPEPDWRSRRLAVSASFGTNLRRASETGAPALGGTFAIGSRLELGLDLVLVAWAAVPSARLRLAGDRVSAHLVAAAPVALSAGDPADPFVAGAAGLLVRVRASEQLALRLEGWASYGGADHGTTLPAFLGGELWF